MRPQGHLAGGAIAGALLSRHRDLPAAPTIIATALAANVPDLDTLLPIAFRFLGVRADVNSHNHHTWPSHSALPWVVAAMTLSSRHRYLAQVLALGTATHLLQDMTSDSVAIFWPSRKRYGLRLDGLGTVGHRNFMRRYPATPAGKLERILMIGAVLLVLDTLL